MRASVYFSNPCLVFTKSGREEGGVILLLLCDLFSPALGPSSANVNPQTEECQVILAEMKSFSTSHLEAVKSVGQELN